MGDDSRLVGVNTDTKLGPGEATQSSSEDISITSYVQLLSISHSRSPASSETRQAGLREMGREAWQRQAGKLQLGTIKSTHTAYCN